MDPIRLDELAKSLGIEFDANDPVGSMAKAVADLKAQAAKGEDVNARLASLEEKLTSTFDAEAARKELEDEYQLKLDRAIAEQKMIPTGHQAPDELKTEDLFAQHVASKAVGAVGVAMDLIYMEHMLLERPIAKCTLLGRDAFKKALDVATDASGADWVPTGFSPQFIMDVNAELQLAGCFNRLPMPAHTTKYPVEGTTPTAYYVAENTDLTAYNTNITASSGTTLDVTLTAKKMAVRTIESMEWDADALPMALTIVRNKVIRGIAEGLDDAILNGDSAGTHNDSDITASTDRRKMWLGLRAKCIDDTGANEDVGTLTADALSAIMGNMGKYGMQMNQSIWVTGSAGMAALRVLKDTQGNPVMLTIDKYGANATILKGEVGLLFGRRVIYSDKMRETLNASGVYDGSTTDNTAIIYCWTPAWALGDRQQVGLETARHIGAQAIEIVGTWRGDFEHALSTNLTTAMGYNMAV